MPDDTPSKSPKPSNPTAVREPDNSRPPAEPTPQKPMKPQEAGAGGEEPATGGL